MSKHQITVQEGQAMIAAYADDAKGKGIPFSEDFPKSIGFDIAVLEELAHPDAVRFRVHHAIHAGRKTFVLAAHAADGTMLTAIQNGEFCPPFC